VKQSEILCDADIVSFLNWLDLQLQGKTKIKSQKCAKRVDIGSLIPGISANAKPEQAESGAMGLAQRLLY